MDFLFLLYDKSVYIFISFETCAHNIGLVVQDL